jgi:hypothetical protein
MSELVQAKRRWCMEQRATLDFGNEREKITFVH